MITVIQRVGFLAGVQKQFEGTTYSTPGAGGLIIPSGLPTSGSYEYVLYEASLDVVSTGTAASVGDAEMDLVDLTSGCLPCDAITADPTDGEVVGDGDGDGDFSATIVGYGDGDGDGDGDRVLQLNNISLGALADNDALTGATTFVGTARADGFAGSTTASSTFSIIEYNKLRLKKSSATQQRITWDVAGLPIGKSDDTNGTSYAIRLITTSMVGHGTWTVKYGYRYVGGA